MSIAWFLFIAVIVMVLQGFLYRKCGFANVHYQRSFSQPVATAGEEIELIDEISNRKLLPLPWLRLEAKINPALDLHQTSPETEGESREFHRTLFSLMPYQRIRRHHPLTCRKRGYYRLQGVSLSTGDAFGLNQTLKQTEAPVTLTVYPQIAAVEDVPFPVHSWLGEVTVRRWIMEDPFMHAGVREYDYGDSMNTINWKATARTGNLQVSQKDYTADPSLMVYLNFGHTEDIWLPVREELVEKGLGYAAAIVNEAVENGVSAGFGCNAYFVEPFVDTHEKVKPSVRVEPASSSGQIAYVLDAMAKLKMDRSRTFSYFLAEDVQAERTSTDILLITAVMTDQIEFRIKQLEALGNAVEVLWLDDEKNKTAEEGEAHAAVSY